MISLVQLQYIIAVDTFRHFATAAEKSFVTQPTLSMQIKKMEEELEVKIFDRTKQPVVPTDVGRKIIDQARVVLAEFRKIDQVVQDYTGNVGGELRVGIIPTLATTLLPAFVGNLCRDYPTIQMSIWEKQTNELLEMLSQERLDVAVIVTPIKNPNFKERVIGYEGIQVYTHPDHEFARKSSILPEALQRPDIWLLSDGHCFRNQTINLCAYHSAEGTARNFQYESGSLETLCRLVEKEGGFTLMPEMYTDAIPDTDQGVVRPLAGQVPLRQISLVYTRNFVKDRLLDILHQYISESLPNKMKDKDRGFIVEWDT